MEVITLSLQKGGTGKTTTATGLAEAAASKGLKVLAIDLDSQGNLSFSLAAQMPAAYTSYNLLTEPEKGIVIQHTRTGVDIIPAAWELVTIGGGEGAATRLAKAIEPLKERYDLIIVDTPGGFGIMQLNAIYAATKVLMPLEADIYNLQSVYQTLDAIKQVQGESKKPVYFCFNAIDTRSGLSKELKDKITIEANKVNVNFVGTIRRCIAISEAIAYQQNLYEYAPRSNSAKDYLMLLDNIL